MKILNGHPSFSPTFFSHGRLLYRFPGSDACRFSPKLAYALLEDATKGDTPPAILWDPFCGSGLIVSIARLFFAAAFQGIVASDIDAKAAACTRKNILLVSDLQAAFKQLHRLRGLQKRNAKSQRRWGEVATYLEALLPLIQENQRCIPSIRIFAASVFAPPLILEEAIHFVGDLPYGKSSYMEGNRPAETLLDHLAALYPNAKMTFVAPRATAERFAARSDRVTIQITPCKNNRAILRTIPKSRAEPVSPPPTAS